MSEDIFHFSVCFHGVKRKYLNSGGSGCNTHRTPKPGGVSNSHLESLFLGHYIFYIIRHKKSCSKMEVPKEETDLGINLVWVGKIGFICVMFQPLQ